ncbi:hypothetical protein ACIQGZ_17780 [Streptomyces sp. NPDC092296]|uniref:hypothetical protein n=1 Tax=Streptomyces sp. NPDC092296 TaxID=3366012 RepID=UPI003829D4D2
MGASFGVGEIRLIEGTVVQAPSDGMTVFIGPDNSGKSMLLRELGTLVGDDPGTPEPLRWVADVRCAEHRQR